MLSICITVNNRSKVKVGTKKWATIFPNCLKSIIACSLNTNYEIVICDFYSTDWPLKDWIYNYLDDIPHQIIFTKEPFNIGRGRNKAAKIAKGDWLFFLDADMIISQAVIKNGIGYLNKSIIYYPKCFYFLNREHSLGFWHIGGKGNIFINKYQFEESGRWPCPPFYNKPRNEDHFFYKKIKKLGFPIISKKEKLFYHQYHPGETVKEVLTYSKHLIESPQISQ